VKVHIWAGISKHGKTGYALFEETMMLHYASKSFNKCYCLSLNPFILMAIISWLIMILNTHQITSLK